MSPAYSFIDQQEQWSRPPVDDVGYLPSSQLLQLADADLVELIEKMARVRYTGWRNYENRWRVTLGLDDTHGKRILDFGCGTGLEALQVAPTNCVIVAA